MTDFASQWPKLIDRILRIWPETNRKDIENLGGSRAQFVSYLSSCHDITEAEADEMIDTWLLPPVASKDAKVMAAE